MESLRGGSTILFAGYMIGNVIAYFYQMLMSRVLPPTEYGGLVALTSVYYVLAVTVKAVQAWIISAAAGTGGARPVPRGSSSSARCG